MSASSTLTRREQQFCHPQHIVEHLLNLQKLLVTKYWVLKLLRYPCAQQSALMACESRSMFHPTINFRISMRFKEPLNNVYSSKASRKVPNFVNIFVGTYLCILTKTASIRAARGIQSRPRSIDMSV